MNTLVEAQGVTTRVSLYCLALAVMSLIFGGLPVMLGRTDALSAGNNLVENMFMFHAIVMFAGFCISGAAAAHLYRVRRSKPLSSQDYGMGG